MVDIHSLVSIGSRVRYCPKTDRDGGRLTYTALQSFTPFPIRPGDSLNHHFHRDLNASLHSFPSRGDWIRKKTGSRTIFICQLENTIIIFIKSSPNYRTHILSTCQLTCMVSLWQEYTTTLTHKIRFLSIQTEYIDMFVYWVYSCRIFCMDFCGKWEGWPTNRFTTPVEGQISRQLSVLCRSSTFV